MITKKQFADVLQELREIRRLSIGMPKYNNFPIAQVLISEFTVQYEKSYPQRMGRYETYTHKDFESLELLLSKITVEISMRSLLEYRETK